MIARAAHEVGLEHVTMKAVAERLGVSVPGLYHHVEGREDLMRLAAEYSASQIEVPVDHGQHWAEWLLEWAQYMHRAFVAEPELMNQFLHRAIGVERMVLHVDAMLALLLRHGFDPHDAMDAYVQVSQCAIGAALTDLREAEGARRRAARHRRVPPRDGDAPGRRVAEPAAARIDATPRRRCRRSRTASVRCSSVSRCSTVSHGNASLRSPAARRAATDGDPATTGDAPVAGIAALHP